MVNWPWKRNKSENPDNVPQEIQEYYQAEKRERVGVAWALALATLVVTVLLALGLFYGGRWAYRAIFDNEEEPAVVQQDNAAEQTGDNNGSESVAPDDETPAADQPAVLPGEDTDTDNSGETLTDRPDTDSPSTTPATGSDMPETGPGDMTALFIVTSLLGYVSHRTISSYRAKN